MLAEEHNKPPGTGRWLLLYGTKDYGDLKMNWELVNCEC